MCLLKFLNICVKWVNECKILKGYLVFWKQSLLTQFSSLITHHSSLKIPNFLTSHIWHIFSVLITQLFLLFCGTHTLTQRRLFSPFFFFFFPWLLHLSQPLLFFPFVFLWDSYRIGRSSSRNRPASPFCFVFFFFFFPSSFSGIGVRLYWFFLSLF